MSYKQEAEAYKAKAQESLGDQFKVVTDDMDLGAISAPCIRPPKM
jgi:hypothetical protein